MPHGVHSRVWRSMTAQEKVAKNAKLNAKKRAGKARGKFVRSLPQITEANLLSFQLAHFGDDTKPNEWFVESDRALYFEPEYEEEDDGLGYYDDGVKRTLTDEQIAVFRRTELWQLKRDREQQQQEDREADVVVGDDTQSRERAASPASDVSSLEDDLLQYATVQHKQRAPSLAPPAIEETEKPTFQGRKLSQSGQSEATSHSSETKKRKRGKGVPYDQRHKRQWEGYIYGEDPIEGSVTHRRLAREMDDQQTETVEMDY